MPAAPPPSASEVFAEVVEIYAELEKRPLERDCVTRADCCRFRLTGQTPSVTRGEAMLANHTWRRSGRGKLGTPKDGSCPFLDANSGRCGIYQGRPFACRTHFCRAAGGSYPRRSVQDLIWKLEALDLRLGGSGGQSIEKAVRHTENTR